MRLVFIHIQKTAGTAFREHILRKLYSSGDTYLFYGFQKAFSDIKVHGMRPNLVVGHMPVGIHFLLPDCRYYTILREPLKRAISYYDFINPPTARYTHPDWRYVSEYSIGEFYRMPYRDNAMTRMVAGVQANLFKRCNKLLFELAVRNIKKKFIAIGVQEDFLSSVQHFITESGASYEIDNIPLTNVRKATKNKEKVMGLADLSTSDLASLQASHNFDQQLYELVVSGRL